jgi:beta-glucanase (GH16 family)
MINLKSNPYTFLLLLAFVLLSNCVKEKEYALVWSDEFEGALGELPNAQNWTFDIGTGQNGWGNAELQYYTNDPQNVSLDGNGNLQITALKNFVSGSVYSSARIKTQSLKSFTYGKVEARMKLPYGQGIWPAFWMLGDNIKNEGWPQCGEIDIMEYRGQEPQIANGSLHGPEYAGGNAITQKYKLFNSRFDTDFHIFSIEWGEDFIKYFVDGVQYQEITPNDVNGEWVFNDSFFMILNLAVGGSFVGSPNSETIFPQSMKVDYIRVYQIQ